MPSFPPCQEHGIRACPCAHPGESYPGDVAKVDAAIAATQAHLRELQRLRQQVAAAPPPRPRRLLSRAEKLALIAKGELPTWALSAPVTED